MIPISPATIQALETLCDEAREASSAFRNACNRQAEDHDMDPQALARYVRARVSDRVAKLDAERETWEQLSLLSQPAALREVG